MPQHVRQGGFRRQVVFRLGQDDWQLLEQAAANHGSIQAALVAALHTLSNAEEQPSAEALAPHLETGQTTSPLVLDDADSGAAESEELTAREAAEQLRVKPETVRGYIRSGRLPGRYQNGWLTTRGAIADYADRARR